MNKKENEMREIIISSLHELYAEEITETYNFKEFFVIVMEDSYGNKHHTKVFNDRVVEVSNGVFQDEYSLQDYILCCL